MNDNARQDRLLDELIDEIKRRKMPDRPPDENLIARLTASLAQEKNLIRTVSSFTRSLLMKPMVRYSLAALLLLGIALAYFGNTPHVLALSDVIKKVDEHKYVRFKATMVSENTQFDPKSDSPDNPDNPPKLKSTFTVTEDLKGKRSRTETDVPGYRTVTTIDQSKGRSLSVFTYMLQGEDVKKATLALSEKPRIHFEGMESLRKEKNAKATKEKLGNEEALVYRVTADGDLGIKTTTTLWVNPKTKLPIQMEIATSNEKVHFLMKDFEWDPKVSDPDKFFSTEPPLGYDVETVDQRKKK